MSTRRIGGISAASKSVRPHAIRRSYIHDNHFHGVWLDCDGSGWEITDNTIARNFGTGVFYEISRGTAVIARNQVLSNNSGNTAGRGGILVTSSKNASLSDNVSKGNLVSDLKIWEDSRADNGANGCKSGYRISNVVLSGNVLGRAMGTNLSGVTVAE